MQKSETIGALTLALSKAQGMIKGALRDSANPFFKSKYADLESVWEACRVPLSTNELAIVQLSDETDKGVIVETILSHSSGEWIAGRMFVPISKLDAQSVGSATTYARRYCLQMAVGIAPVDDDGNGATGKGDDKKGAKERLPDPPEVKLTPQETLTVELMEYCQGDESRMTAVLAEISHYKTEKGEGTLTLADLNKTNQNDKFQRWCGASLGKLRDKVKGA